MPVHTCFCVHIPGKYKHEIERDHDKGEEIMTEDGWVRRWEREDFNDYLHDTLIWLL